MTMSANGWGHSQLAEAAARVQAWVPDGEAPVGLVLGSGLGGLVERLEQPIAIPYTDIPHMPGAHVPGHAGKLYRGRLSGREVWVLSGRVHLYEGHEPEAVVFGVRLLGRLGVRTLLVTNAAGGVDPTLSPGQLVCIEDHLNLTGRNCLCGPNDETLGPRFVDMTAAYDRGLAAHAQGVAEARGIPLARGIYAGLLGPTYETPAEVRMLRILGASLVGMSTVQEVIAARHVGMRVLGLSCVTNQAAGVGEAEVLSHADVQRVAAAAAGELCALLSSIVAELPEEHP